MKTSSSTAQAKEFDYSQLKLPAVSQHGLDVIDIVNADDVQFDKLERAITKDAMLTGMILKYANSPMYRRHTEVTNVRNAISILGLDNVKSAVMIATMRAYCDPTNPTKEIIWLRTVNLSAAAKLIARKRFRRLSDDIELTALMAEMGALVLANNYLDEYVDVIERALENNTRWSEEEKEIIGTDRAELTQYVLKQLRLPDVTVKALVNYFNRKEIDDLNADEDKHCSVIGLANKVAYAYERQIKDHIVETDKNMQVLGFSGQELSDLQIEYEEIMNENFSL